MIGDNQQVLISKCLLITLISFNIILLFHCDRLCSTAIRMAYLVRVYSLSPECRFMAENVPIQPLNRLSLPIFHVTNSGLKNNNNERDCVKENHVKQPAHHMYTCSGDLIKSTRRQLVPSQRVRVVIHILVGRFSARTTGLCSQPSVRAWIGWKAHVKMPATRHG